ncbi:MAG: TIGR02466 family protein [Proteobacteria bacterium]|nr:TIGR02466 family protein [Pseudomonadota bacterium]
MNQPAEMQIQVHGLFPTPVVHAELPDSGRINAALRAVIEARMASHPSTDHSNLGGWQSSWDLAEWGGDCANQVLAQAKALANRLTCDRQGKPVNVDWRLNAWANVNSTGHGNEFHTHPGSFWSGTYYVDDGGIGADPALGGEFEIQDPRGVAPAMYAPLLAFNVPGGLAAGSSETIPPQAGRILLFPAWLSHAVRPYLGQRQRISIAFNLSI